MALAEEPGSGFGGHESENVLRFCLVGGVGFLVDAGVLVALHHVGAGAVVARGVSAPVAVIVTFVLNRHYTFADVKVNPWAAFARYVASQGVGLACNLVVYMLTLSLVPEPLRYPVLCLALASGAALVVNYLGSRFFVFTRANG